MKSFARFVNTRYNDDDTCRYINQWSTGETHPDWKERKMNDAFQPLIRDYHFRAARGTAHKAWFSSLKVER